MGVEKGAHERQKENGNMAGVNGELAREYLEALGYVTRPARKYQVIARAKAPHEEADWLGWNPAWIPGVPRPRAGLWGAAELARVPGVVAAVRGWHTERFTSERLEGAPEVWRFAEEASMRASRAALGVAGAAAVVVLSDLPEGAEERSAAVESLVRHGVEGVVLFKTLLLDLLDRVDAKKNYEGSDVLQVLRILKAHRLTRSRQMLLEEGVGRRRRPAGSAGVAGGAQTVAETGALWNNAQCTMQNEESEIAGGTPEPPEEGEA